MTMSDRLAVMRHGRIEQIGEPEDVYEHPRTEFVAGFLGASNMIDGKVVESNGAELAVRMDSGETFRMPAGPDGFAVGTRVRMGVRPEKVTIEPATATARDGWNSIEGLLRMTTYIGVGHQYTVEGPGEVDLTAWVQNLGQTDPPDPGTRVRLSWQRQHTFAVLPQAGASEEIDPFHDPTQDDDEEEDA